MLHVLFGEINRETRKKFLHDKVFVFPASLFKVQRPDRTYRSNYKEILSNLRTYKLLAQQVKLFRDNISYQKVFISMQTICNGLPLDNYYKRFYIEIVTLRYMCIVLRLNSDKSYKLLEEELKIYG